MKLNYPTSFNIVYPDKNKNYYNWNNQSQIKELLTTASNGYCMYCGNKIEINGKNYGQLEHSIEKTQNGTLVDYLTHCKYNFSIACSTCNTSFKKNIRGINIDFNYSCSDECYYPCNEYLNNCINYFNVNEIITMPAGVENRYTKIPFKIEYSLLNMTFLPSEKFNYEHSDIEFIESHIDRFKMNSEDYMPSDILRVCEYVIKNNIIPYKYNYNNIIADIFIDFLDEKNSIQNVKKICKLILIVNSI